MVFVCGDSGGFSGGSGNGCGFCRTDDEFDSGDESGDFVDTDGDARWFLLTYVVVLDLAMEASFVGPTMDLTVVLLDLVMTMTVILSI